MGYKSDQFISTSGFEPSLGAYTGDAINPPFVGPRSTIRTFVKNTRDDNGQLVTKWENTPFTLKKGYIRSLLDKVQISDTAIGSAPQLRCNFQFNPSTIQHSVPMRTNLTNVFLQDPAQMSQPIGGEVTFAFELLFDRSHTLNNSSGEGGGTQGSPDEQDIGVLADIRALYQVIGQGITEKTMKWQLENARQQMNAQIEMGSVGTLTESQAETAQSSTFIEDTNYFSGEGGNIGNTAFLIPTPVRVMFSSLFMVDGYVTQTDVVYTKFSRSLVPMQCIVTLSMQAMYVGFAKEKTFLTYNLEEAAAVSTQQISDNIEKSRNTLTSVVSGFKKTTVYHKIRVVYDTDKTSVETSTFDDRTSATILIPYYNNSTMSSLSGLTNPGDAIKIEPFINIKVSTTIKDSEMESAFSDGTNMSLTAYVTTYGPMTSEDADYLVSASKRSPFSNVLGGVSDSDSRVTNLRTKKISMYTVSKTINTFEDWKQFKKGFDFTADRSFFNTTNTVGTLKTLASRTDPNRFFAVIYSLRIDSTSRGQRSIMDFQTNGYNHEVGPNWVLTGPGYGELYKKEKMKEVSLDWVAGDLV
jgi:hypothetical protein